MKEESREKIKNIIMNDYDLRPSIAEVVVDCLINSCEKIAEEDNIARYNPQCTNATLQSIEFNQTNTLGDKFEIHYCTK